eukprot:g6887.t1
MFSSSSLHLHLVPRVYSFDRSIKTASHRHPFNFRTQNSVAGSGPINESGNLSSELELLTGEDPVKNTDDDAKELIVNLSRKGDGWGEEIVPTVTIQWRPIQKTKRRIRTDSRDPYSWKEGSLEHSLAKAGVLNEAVEKVGAAAAAWRVTPKGRPLIDRRRRTRVKRNITGVTDYLVNKCGVPSGELSVSLISFFVHLLKNICWCDGVGLILTRVPQILLAKVDSCDQWNRRILELAAFHHFHDHCNVPEDWSISPVLYKWIQKIRVSWSEGAINSELLQILHVLGFEFEQEIHYITNEWEAQFDTFIEWIFWNKERNRPIDWTCLSWAKQGGWNAGRVACWIVQQRELKKRNLLPKDAIQRLEIFGFKWSPDWGLDNELEEWFSLFGSLGFAVEQHKSNLKKIKNYSVESISLSNGSTSSLFKSQNEAFGLSKSEKIINSSSPFYELQDWESASKKLGQLESMGNLELESEVHQWLEQQRLLWREQKLPIEKIQLFYSLGLDLNPYSPQQWRHLTHQASQFLMNFEIIDEMESEDFKIKSFNEDFAIGPNMLVMPENIVSISETGSITERIKWNTFQSLNTDEITEEGAVITMDPELPLTTCHHEVESSILEIPNKNYESPLASRTEIRDWVLTQQVLWKERRLTRAQVLYLAVSGLTWILCKDITEMSDEEWTERFNEIKNGCSLKFQSPELEDFITYQRGLYWAGLLSPNRIQCLNSIDEFLWSHDEKSEGAKDWDQKISELICFRKENGHCKVEGNSELGLWLAQQSKQISSLSRVKSLQLRALNAPGG